MIGSTNCSPAFPSSLFKRPDDPRQQELIKGSNPTSQRSTYLFQGKAFFIRVQFNFNFNFNFGKCLYVHTSQVNTQTMYCKSIIHNSKLSLTTLHPGGIRTQGPLRHALVLYVVSKCNCCECRSKKVHEKSFLIRLTEDKMCSSVTKEKQ
jgi:hypothetical protein